MAWGVELGWARPRREFVGEESPGSGTSLMCKGRLLLHLIPLTAPHPLYHSHRYELIRPGEPAELVVLCSDTSFQSFKVSGLSSCCGVPWRAARVECMGSCKMGWHPEALASEPTSHTQVCRSSCSTACG